MRPMSLTRLGKRETLMTLRHAILAIFVVAALSTPAQLQAQQVLRVGTNEIGSPWSFHDAAANSERGIAIDLITEIGKDTGYSIQLVPMPTIVALIPALLANKIDVIAANMLVSPERQALIDFSEPLFIAGDGLVVLKSDTKDYKSLEDLKGDVIGTQSGTPFVPLIQKTGLFPDLKTYTSVPEAMQAVSDGQIKAAVVGSLTAAYEQHMDHFQNLRIVKSYRSLITGPDALGVRKTDGELLNKINTSLDKLKANGTMSSIFAKYGIEWKSPD
jgi:polar amino acid transport system substrate-binding protein